MEALLLDLTPLKQDLDPIEVANQDEIAGLQVQRLKWSLRHACDKVPLYRQGFKAAGVMGSPPSGE